MNVAQKENEEVFEHIDLNKDDWNHFTIVYKSSLKVW